MGDRRWKRLGFAVALGLAAGWWGTAAAQGQNPDVLAALLVEVRGLRASMEQMASAGPRIQLATARLQLQEQRINNLLRRLESTRDGIANRQQELAEQQERLRQADREMKERNLPLEGNSVIEMITQAVASKTAGLQRLQLDEAQLTQDINAEQARWSDINQRLDELDRALTKK